MKITNVTKTPMPLINDNEPPSKHTPATKAPKTKFTDKFQAFRIWISKYWIVKKLINTPAYWLCVFFAWAKLAKRTTYLALLAIFILLLHVAATAYFLKAIVISVAPWTYVRTAHAAEVKPTKQAKTYTIPQIVDAVHILESSGGVKDGCIAKGKINGFGFAQTGDGKTWDCFKNYKEVRTRVEQWYTEKLKTMTLAQALCYYNLGKPKGVLLNDCPYYQNFLKVVES